MKSTFYPLPILLLFSFGLFFIGCGDAADVPASAASTSPGDDPFFKEKGAQLGGKGYLDSYPLDQPDSCLARVRREIPDRLQAWSCLSIWYRLPRNKPENCFRWLDLYEKNYPHDTVAAFAQMMRGEFMVEMKQHDTARTLLADARERYLRLGRLLDASDADFLVGQSLSQQKQLAPALEAFYKVLELLNRHDTTFSHRHASVYREIATVHHANKDFEQSIFWLKKILDGDQSKLSEAWKYQSRTASQISTKYALLGKFDSSLVMARLAADIFRANSTKPLPAEIEYRLGFAHLKKGDCHTALRHFSQAAQRGTGSANNLLQTQIEQSLAEAYFCLGRLDSAEYFLKKSFATTDSGNLAAGHWRLGEIHARRGDFRAAYDEEKLGGQLFKSAFDIEKSAALTEYQTRYETAEKEHQIRELEQQRKNEQQQKIIILLSLLLALGVLAGLFFRQRMRHIRQILQVRRRIADDLHDDVAASLNYLSMLVKSLRQRQSASPGSPEIAGRLTQIEHLNDEVIGKLSDIVWAIDERSQTFGKLAERMQDYGEDVLLQNNVPLHFQIHAEHLDRIASLAVRQHVLLIFKEAVSNIVRHTKSYDVQILIENRAENLEIRLENHFSETRRPQFSTGKGLESMARRAENLGGKLHIERGEGLFRLRLSLPHIFD